MHKNTGNQYAKKDNPKTAHLGIRCTPDDKERIKSNAQKEGLSVSSFVINRTK